MRILVTGATGFIGKHLVVDLVNAGHEVAVLNRSESSQSLMNTPEGVIQKLNIVYGDLRNFNLISRAIRDAAPEVVVHLAAAGVSDPYLSPHAAIRNNTTGTINLLRGCFENRLSDNRPNKVIVGRTPGEIGPSNIYAASKAASWNFCEMFVRSQGWPIIGARIFQTYGLDQPRHMLVPGTIEAALNGSDYPLTSGNQARDWIHVSDVARALTMITSTHISLGDSIDIGTGIATTVAEVANMIYALASGPGRPLIGLLPDRMGESDHPLADATKTYSQIGWRARLSLEEGLKKTLEEMSSGT